MPNDILESVKDFNTITIFRHVFADMDAIGSQFGLKYYLESSWGRKELNKWILWDATPTKINKISIVRPERWLTSDSIDLVGLVAWCVLYII